MPKLSEEMKQMIATQQCFIATVRPDGVPNIGPKKSMRVLDDETLVYNEGTARQTLANLQHGAKAAVAVANTEVMDGYRFVGTATVHQQGPLYESVVANAQKAGRPAPKAVVTIAVEEIYTLKPGKAGTRLA